MIDEMTITTIPVLLGGGVSLFGDLSQRLEFECVESKIYLDRIVQNKFRRKN
jgi:dihydrofolate reductase